jgi:hypothetical protein
VTAASGARRASIQRDDALAYVAGYMDGRKNAERNTGHVAWRSQPRLQGIYDEGYEQAVEDARLDKLIAELGLGDDDSHALRHASRRARLLHGGRLPDDGQDRRRARHLRARPRRSARSGGGTAMKFVLDGLPYDEYPDEQERLARLRADRDEWKRIALRSAGRLDRDDLMAVLEDR